MDLFEAIQHGGKDAANLKLLADAEAQDNDLDFKRRKGDPVTYGQVLQLFHVASGQYVRSSPTTTSVLDARYLVPYLIQPIFNRLVFRIIATLKSIFRLKPTSFPGFDLCRNSKFEPKGIKFAWQIMSLLRASKFPGSTFIVVRIPTKIAIQIPNVMK